MQINLSAVQKHKLDSAFCVSGANTGVGDRRVSKNRHSHASIRQPSLNWDVILIYSAG